MSVPLEDLDIAILAKIAAAPKFDLPNCSIGSGLDTSSLHFGRESEVFLFSEMCEVCMGEVISVSTMRSSAYFSS